MAPNDYTVDQTFTAGDRVELHPGTNLWMQGAKYGTVHGVSLTTINAYRVTIDHPSVKGLKTFRADRLRLIAKGGR